MENNQNQTPDELEVAKKQRDWLLPAGILISAVIISASWIYTARLKALLGPQQAALLAARESAALEEKVLPKDGVILPASWGDLGAKMVGAGVIDREKFEAVYAERGGLGESEKKLLSGGASGQLKITKENSGVLLNLLWAFGLANKNEILEKGPMTDAKYGGAKKFASTGGWTLAASDAMAHYSAHRFVTLTASRQKLVEDVSKNIYRPCCGNSTYFPDCNHGMAMLGLLELMASQGVSEGQMYKVALAVNSFWFPENYLTIAKYLQVKGVAWGSADPKGILGNNFSSAAGYRQILSQVQPVENKSGGGCGV